MIVSNISVIRARFVHALIACAAAALFTVGGCPTQSSQTDSALSAATSKLLSVGDSMTTLRPSVSEVLEVEVPEGKSFEVLLESTGDATIAVEQIESPDGGVFQPSSGKKNAEGNDSVSVERFDGAKSVRVAGRVATGGTWRIHVRSSSALTEAALRNAAKTRSVTENLLLLLYLMNGAPDDNGFLAQAVRWSYPEFDALRAPVDVRLTLRVLEGDAFAPVPSDGGGSGAGSGGGGGSGEGSGGGDPNSGGSGGGSENDPNSGGGGGSTDPNSPGGGADPNAPPSTPAPTKVDVTRIVRTGDPVPNQPSATFTVFSNPVIDSEGRVAFWGGYKNGAGTGGLYVYQNGNIVEVLRGDKNNLGVVPGGSPNSFWGPITIAGDGGKAPTMAWGSGGRLLFTTYTNNSPLPNGLYRWRAGDGNMIRVVDDTTFKSVFPNVGDTFLPEFYHPGLTDDGLVVFGSRFSYFDKGGQFFLFKRGVFVSNGNTISPVIADTLTDKQPVPNGGSQSMFFTPEILATVGADGNVVAQAQYVSGNSGRQGLFSLSNGTLSMVIDSRQNASWPGLPAGVQVGLANGPFDAFAAGAGARYAIQTKLTEGGNQRDGLVYFSGAKWNELRSADDQPSTALISGINSAGSVLYLAGGAPHIGDASARKNLSTSFPLDLRSMDTVEWESFGGSINNQGRAIVRYKRTDSPSVGLVLWTGVNGLIVAESAGGIAGDLYDTLFAQARPTLQKITDTGVGVLKDRPEVDRPGRSGMFNDLDQVVFRAGSAGPDTKLGTSDDVQAVFIAKGN